MGMWGWLSGRKPPARAIVTGDGEFEFPVVGESNYQDELGAIAGGRTERGVRVYCAALLSPEPSNPHDKNAVAVTIRGRKVGYLGREHAPVLCRALTKSRLGDAVCAAVIFGGRDRGDDDQGHFGVRLDMALPFAFRPSSD